MGTNFHHFQPDSAKIVLNVLPICKFSQFAVLLVVNPPTSPLNTALIQIQIQTF